MNTRLALIHELYAGAAPADRCPHLTAPDAEGCRCAQLAGTTVDRLVCDHFSLQLWCLAGPERWPVCEQFPEDSNSLLTQIRLNTYSGTSDESKPD